MPHCVICNQDVAAWKPHPHADQSGGVCKMLKSVGSDLSIFLCPACGCCDRDRHLWLFMNAAKILPVLNQLRILHIAPEPHIEWLIKQQNPPIYVRGDLHPRNPEHLTLNVEQLPMQDGNFHLIICNHVLEHVDDPRQALREFHRCLAPGGTLIAQTPYAPMLKNTLEVNEPTSPEFNTLFYGQDDHVRLFGADIADYFRNAGFQGTPLANTAVLGHMSAAEFGFNAREPFFAFTK